MKPKGRHPDRVLTVVKVRSLKTPGRYADGNGLYLVVDDSGAKRWMLRTMVKGRRSDIGLGGTGLISLAEVREKASALRRIARAGGDPLSEKRAYTVEPTFAEAARLVHNGRIMEEQEAHRSMAQHAEHVCLSPYRRTRG